MKIINKLGVIGAGVMGAGVAENAATSGFDVTVIDVSDENLQSCRQQVEQNLRFAKMFRRDQESTASLSPEQILSKIKFTTDYALLRESEFIVENATEKLEVKEAVYRELSTAISSEVVIAANTSCFSITRLGSLVSRPENLLGIHFMNPVSMKPVVEMIQGHWTSEKTIETARRFLAQMGKEGVLVNDAPGFVSNRVLMLTINEAVMVLQDGVSVAPDVDKIFKDCFGHKMGPLETADLIGLDTILFSIEVLQESFGDSKYRPAPLLKRMVDAGLLGRKSGEGFYQYGGAKK